MTTPGGPGSLNPNARFGITGDSAHGTTVADLQQRLQAEMEDRLKADIKGSSGWKGASDAAFGGLMLRGTPGQPVSIPLAIVASLAGRLLGVNPQSWLTSTDPHENIEHILADLKKVPLLGDLIEVITGVEDGDESDLGTWALGIRNALQGIDLSDPGSILTAIGKAAGQFFKGVIPVSWLADVIQDLINGAGEFLNAGSVTANPYWSWDSVMPGWHGGGSVRASANGTQQVLRVEDPTDVVAGQILKIQSGVRWAGLTATAGSNPIKVGWTPYDANGNPMADVIVSQLQPSTTDGAWQWVPAISGMDKWTVPAGVSKVTPLLILDSGATAGNVWFSNVLPWLSNLAGQELIHNLPDDLGDLADGIAANVVALAGKLAQGDFDGFLAAIFGIANPSHSAVVAKFQALGADGKIDITNIIGLAAQLAAYALQSAVQTFMDTVGGTVGASMTDIFNRLSKLSATGQINGATGIAGALNEAQTGVNAVRDAIANGLGLIGSGLTNLQVQNQATLTAQIAAQAAAAAAAANAQLAKSQGQQNAAGGGLNYTTVFGGADGAALPAEFTGSDLKVRGNNGYAGIAASKPDGTYVVTCNKQCSTDDQSLAVVLGDQGGSPSAPEYHLFHSDSGFTAGACLKIDNGSATIGSYTRSGSTITFTAFSGGAWSGALGQGSLVEVHNVGTTWTLSINGNPVLPVTSSAVTFGAGTRYGGGVVMVRATVNLGWFQGTVTYDSFRVASITLSDYVDPVYLGSGATMARTSATNVTVATGTTVLPNSFYTVVQAATPDIACNLTNGTMTPSLSGWYLAKVATKSNVFTNSTNSSGQAQPAIFINSTTTPSKLGLPQQYSRSNSSDGSVDLTIPVLALSDSVPIYLNAGDVVRAGQVIGSNASTRQVTGDSAGAATYFSLSLLNRSQI
ncbi:hypothetical protein [Mycobacteroides abscessus]|uniref:hypothetical protein n=1 Tax=Mycobacteroides abscessus TaxID=36809 RepID=UPI00092C428E|nr:hypothetical protein [Mycobacteroides abscessus]QSM04922.1 minor tail protein [Mycobacterium phage prophi91-4]MDO3335167.1 hypothetical protein [Mycobacteroides abscessus subsp. bolletii]QSM87799.1 hypothetical protein I3U44_18545 [Mycobacteroides abscessus subsp. bolletii]SIB02033.1 Bacteriophage protein [Mycobacteroides abscessus subsp. bolletii]SII68965.1 Bacteriophage protein [Mycobacteroides abscessus subsp. bolletii]